VLIKFRSATLCFLFVFGVSMRLFAAATGTITVGGAEQVSAGGTWDTGTVTLILNGPISNPGAYSESVPYGQFSTPASIASALAATFSQDCNSPAWAHAVGAQITFQMRASATNLASLTLTSAYNQSAFSAPSFTDGVTNGVIVLPGQPVIVSLLMTNGNAGTPITLSGINFGTSGIVVFNGTPVSSTAPNVIWTPTSITVPIPSGATSGLVFVTTSGLISNGVPITLTEAVSCPTQ